MSDIISVCVSDEEKTILEEYSNFYKRPVSTMMKETTIKYLEDMYDAKIVKDYEYDLALGKESLASWNNFRKEN